MSWARLTKNIKKILANDVAQEALNRAGDNYEDKFLTLVSAEPIVDDYKEELRNVKEKILSSIDESLERLRRSFEAKGVKVFIARDKTHAHEILQELIGTNNIIVKGKSMVCEEIELREFLGDIGNEIWETDVGEFIIQIANDKPMHVITPSIHYTKEKTAQLLSKFFKKKVDPNDIPGMVKLITSFLRDKYFRSTVGILGANVIAIDDAAIVTIHNEGNLRFIASMVKKLIFVTDITKIVYTLEQAIKAALVISRSAGYKIAGYIDIFSKFYDDGAYGPKEVYLVLIDNGRKNMLRNKEFREIGYCLRCGACMYVCPTYRVLGRYYGGSVYMGGIGALLSYFTTDKPEDIIPVLFLCLECDRCLQVCPMSIDVPQLAKKIISKAIRSKFEKQ